ncbi:hypothetical protein XENTR_v10023123 [Xenopus tropicalis]|nr:hypothetical protein XENTR_v10023123 [Xenopus tropicalis]
MRGGRVLTVPARSTVGGGEPITALHSHKHRQASVPYQVSLAADWFLSYSAGYGGPPAPQLIQRIQPAGSGTDGRG